MVPTGFRDEYSLHRLAVLITVLLLCSAVAAPGLVVAESTDVATLEDGFDEADEIYIDENGDAILVYDGDGDGELDELHAGAHVAEGLLHLFGAERHASNEADEVDGAQLDMSALLTGDVFEADGSLAYEQPDELADLDAYLAGEVSDETNAMQADVTSTFVDDEAGTAVGDVETAGTVIATHDAFSLVANGTVSQDGEPLPDTERFDLTVEQSSVGYTAHVTHHEYKQTDVEGWESEEAATESLLTELEPIADELDAEVTVDVDHHSLEERDDRQWLELAYSIELEGVDDGLAQLITEELMHDPTIDLDEEQAAAIGEAVTEIDIENFDLSYVDDGATVTADADVQISGFDEVIFEVIETLEAEADDEIDGLADVYEAQAAAETSFHLHWDVDMIADESSTGETTTSIDAVASYDVANWEAYVEELEQRDIETADFNVAFELMAEDVGDEIHVDGEFVLEQEDLVSHAMDHVSSILGDVDDPGTSEFNAILEETELEVAKVDVSMTDQAVTIEAGAQIEDLDAFFRNADVIPAEFVIDDSDGDTYVLVTDLVDEPATIDTGELQGLDVVGSETEIHEPGTWDRELPSFDLESAAAYLDVEISDDDAEGEEESEEGEIDDGEDDIESEDDDTEEPADDSIPGFGIGLTVVSVSLSIWSLRWMQ